MRIKRKNIGRVAGVAAASLALGAMAQSALAAAPACGLGNDAQTIGSTIAAPLTIPDGNPTGVSDPIVVSGKTGVLRDVDVTTNITHPFNRDLSIKITHVTDSGSKTVQLIKASATNRNGQNGFNGTVWDDSVGNPNTKTVSEATKTDLNVDGPVAFLIPEGSLGAFVGDDPNGTWTLTATDALAVDVGTLNGWSLNLATSAPPAATLKTVTGGEARSVADGLTTTQTVTSPLTVSGVQGYLTDINLRTDIEHHDDPGELRIWLTSPAGTKVLISNNRGTGSLTALTTTWDDSATPLITQAAWANTGPDRTHDPIVPEGALAAFIGENANSSAHGGAPWLLTIEDINPPTVDNPLTPTVDESLQYGFDMSGWSLQLATAAGCDPAPAVVTPPPPPPPAPPAPIVTPIIGGSIALPAPSCVKVGLATKVIGATKVIKGKNGVITLQVKNSSTGASARDAVASFAIPSGFTLAKKPAGAIVKKGRVTLALGTIAAGRTRTVSLTLKAGAKATTGLRKSSVSSSAACGSKGTGKIAVTIRKA